MCYIKSAPARPPPGRRGTAPTARAEMGTVYLKTWYLLKCVAQHACHASPLASRPTLKPLYVDYTTRILGLFSDERDRRAKTFLQKRASRSAGGPPQPLRRTKVAKE